MENLPKALTEQFGKLSADFTIYCKNSSPENYGAVARDVEQFQNELNKWDL